MPELRIDDRYAIKASGFDGVEDRWEIGTVQKLPNDETPMVKLKMRYGEREYLMGDLRRVVTSLERATTGDILVLERDSAAALEIRDEAQLHRLRSAELAAAEERLRLEEEADRLVRAAKCEEERLRQDVKREEARRRGEANRLAAEEREAANRKRKRLLRERGRLANLGYEICDHGIDPETGRCHVELKELD